MTRTHQKTGNPVLSVSLRATLDRFQLVFEHEFSRRATGLFGPSGAGKTTVLEVIAGLRHDASGSVRMDGDVWLDSASRVRVPPERRQIGYAPQDGLLFPHLDVMHNLLSGRSGETSPKARQAELRTVAEMLEVGGLLHRRVATLSGGERQRVVLGRALLRRPRLLLLDEPLGALDGPLRRRLVPLLGRALNTAGAPLIVVSHDPSELMDLCDEVVVLAAGRVRAVTQTHGSRQQAAACSDRPAPTESDTSTECP